MGGEQIRAGKLVYLFAAVIVISFFAGCSWSGNTRPVTRPVTMELGTPPQCPPQERLAYPKKLLAQGDIEGALRGSQKALALPGKKSSADEALFTMGLAHIHYKNPKPDYRQGAEYFRKLVKDYPQSPLADQALTWIEVLHVIEQSKEVDLEIERMKKELGR
jgi:hypothetical protein